MIGDLLGLQPLRAAWKSDVWSASQGMEGLRTTCPTGSRSSRVNPRPRLRPIPNSFEADAGLPIPQARRIPMDRKCC